MALRAVKLLMSILLPLSSLIPLSAELMIVSVDSKGYARPLELQSLTPMLKKELFGIMIKYQWPSNTVFAFSDEFLADECAKIFNVGSDFGQGYFKTALQKIRSVVQKMMNSSASYTECDVIRSIIQEKYGTSYDVMYVPTTLYELFALSYLFKETSTTFMHNVQNFQGIGVDAVVTQCIARQGAQPKDVFKAYRELLALGLLADIEEVSGGSNAEIPLLEIYFELNQQCVDYLLSGKNVSPNKLANKIEKERLKIGADLVKDVASAYSSATFMTDSRRKNAHEFTFSYAELSNELSRDEATLDPDKILARTLTLEYVAQRSNRGLLFRGTSFLADVGVLGRKFSYLIDTTLCTDPKTICFDTEHLSKLVPRSVCYGNSLFAGGLNDIGAMVYSYWVMPDRSGYALDIDKQAYFTHRCNNLFYVSPFPTLLGIFGFGQFFHSRTTAITTSVGASVWIDGIQHDAHLDHAGLFLAQGNGIQFEARFSNYLADHAHVMTFEHEGLNPIATHEKALKKAHRQLAGILSKV